jgi:outer membrane protein assembly factor BamB
MTWRYEDGGPRRTQTVPGGLGLRPGAALGVTTRVAPAVTMVVGSPGGDLYLLRHTAGDGAVAMVERIDPITLEPSATSAELAAGPVWPGGMGVADDGSLHVVFGNHAHRLSPELAVLASRTLPRQRPYNSFVPLPDGHLVTKDFGGSRPGLDVAAADRQSCELVVLEPDRLDIVARLEMPEPSIARLSADGADVYVVGDTSLLRARWDGRTLALDDSFAARYRTLDGQTYGWDCVLAAGAAWFLDNGDGSEHFNGTLRGHGVSTAPLHLVRVDVATGAVALQEICGLPGGLVANPPVVDEARGVVVAYDTGNGVLAGHDIATLAPIWRRDQDHGSHLLLYAGSGELVTGDRADVVVLDVATGAELARADAGAGIQSVLFPAPGAARDFYVCTFLTVSRIAVA